MKLLKLAVLVAAFLAAGKAGAHEPYSGLYDPVTGGRCCGGSDCAVLKIEPGMIEAVEQGYRLTLTTEQARRINPARRVPVDTVIPWDRMKPSFDGNYHLCLPSYPIPGATSDFYCFFAPGSM